MLMPKINAFYANVECLDKLFRSEARYPAKMRPGHRAAPPATPPGGPKNVDDVCVDRLLMYYLPLALRLLSVHYFASPIQNY